MPIQPGTKLKSVFNADIEIVKLLGEGGQGFVFEIRYNGEPKALKVYKPVALKDPVAFYKNLKNNIDRGSPSPAFLWPQDLLPPAGKIFGYVMDLRPKGYEELTAFLTTKARYESYKVLLKAALEIIAAFRILHNDGYSYQDLNDGNFFINPKTGDVLICDNDNVAEDGFSTGILGKPRYMAPEIVCGKNMPNIYSDRFSLSVILFLMMTNTHPLEGKRYLKNPLTPADEVVLYGREPIFILDEKDDRNRPVMGIHKNIGPIWSILPQYVKDMFLRAFSKEVLEQPNLRIRETDWQKLLMRFSSDIICCERCGAETFLTDPGKAVTACGNGKCGRPFPAYRKLSLNNGKTEVLLSLHTIIYREHFNTANVKEAGNSILRVVKGSRGLMLHNISDATLACRTPSGNAIEVPPNGTIPLIPGVRIRYRRDVPEAVVLE